MNFGENVTSDNRDDDILNEPPILEELGIDPKATMERMKSVVMFKKITHEMLEDSDLTGPLAIGIALGIMMLLAGKINFGFIYGLSICGSLGMYLLLNLMSQQEAIDMYRTLSILGYGLLPIVVLAFLNIFLPMASFIGGIVSIAMVLWATATASRFFEAAMSMDHQRILVAYPTFLLYGSFAILTVL